jgi:methyl-accepting chemotaxis protein
MKIIHSLRFQFIALFTALLVIVNIITTIMGIQQMTRSVIIKIDSQGVLIVEKDRDLVDGDKFEALARSLNADDPFYIETQQALLNVRKLSSCVNMYTMAQKSGNTWYYVIDGSAEIGSKDFSDLGDEENVSGFDPAFQKSINTGITSAGGLVDQGEWGWLISVYAPIRNSSGKVVGVIACDFDGGPLHESIVEETKINVTVSLISILLQIGIALFFMWRIFTPIKKIDGMLVEISQGEGDLTKRINMNAKHEMGELAKYFNQTLDRIRNLVLVIRDNTQGLLNIGNDLASNMQETAGAINEITANIMNIKQKMTGQAASVTETSATMEQMTENIVKLGKNIESQSHSVSQSSSAIEQMLANIQSVTNTLIRNAENVDELIGSSNVGRDALQKVIQDIQAIAEQSEGLLAINSVMENIASQTSLLSMNAAIEAAHAGESGKGFAVVAAEIRKLATSSSEQSKTISDVLKKIKTSIDTIKVSTNKVLEKFQDIDGHVRVVSEQETNIRTAMEEQGEGSKQILDAIGQLNELTLTVKQEMQRMGEGSKEVLEESKNLDRSTAEITGGMNEMSTGAEQINLAINHVADISKENKEHIDKLFTEVSKFKV